MNQQVSIGMGDEPKRIGDFNAPDIKAVTRFDSMDIVPNPGPYLQTVHFDLSLLLLQLFSKYHFP
jgi:hypothetical protein